jgi:integrase
VARKSYNLSLKMIVSGFPGIPFLVRVSPETRNELVEETNLPAVYAIARVVQKTTLLNLHFGKLLRSTGFWRPFQRKRVAVNRRYSMVNRTLQLLGQAFNLANKRGTLSRAPYIRKLTEADNVRQGFFTEAQIREILANLPDDGLRDFVEWAACTGQRKGEITSLTWDVVDGGEIRIPGEVCKNRRPRVIPIGPELAAIIEKRKKARRVVSIDGVTRFADPIFHRGDGLPVGEFKKSWATATKKAKCEGKLFHDVRRTCARRLLAAGVPQVIARELTRHRTSAMFDRYAMVSSADVLAAQTKVAEFRKQA